MTAAGTFLSAWLPVLAWAAGIFYLSSIPSLNSGLGVWDFVLRKIAHMVEFAALTALLLRAFRSTARSWRRGVGMGASGTLALLYAMSDEFHQSFVPGRSCTLRDVMVDAIGIAFTLFLFLRMKPIYE